ncbi:MAG: PhnD/SsuA/transferrin family substrate-binding protein [Pseudomonadota bacterium]
MSSGLGARGQASSAIRFGLTPVFLDNDLSLLKQLQDFLGRQTGRDIQLVQRKTYEEITSLLISGQLTAAWICGYPYTSYAKQLSIVAVPVWRGKPLYQSYLIVAADRKAAQLTDLRHDLHAFSDPNSNSGYLVTLAALAKLRQRPEEFFRKAFFTYSHRNVVRAVASGLAESGSVDGYVWEVIAELEPELARRTKIIARSEWLGFPPVACLKRSRSSQDARAVERALLNMQSDPDGAEVLRLLRLDGFVTAPPTIYDGIARKVREARSLRS